MKYPQLVILESDGWLAKHLRPLADENRWLIREPRAVESALGFACEFRPAVLIVQLDLTAATTAPFSLIAEVHRHCPDVSVVAISDVKLNDSDRIAWTALLMDLGSRFVLFPPLTRPVVEDVVSGLMAVSVRRVRGMQAMEVKRTEETPV